MPGFVFRDIAIPFFLLEMCFFFGGLTKAWGQKGLASIGFQYCVLVPMVACGRIILG